MGRRSGSGRRADTVVGSHQDGPGRTSWCALAPPYTTAVLRTAGRLRCVKTHLGSNGILKKNVPAIHCWLGIAVPAMNRWAILKSPFGTTPRWNRNHAFHQSRRDVRFESLRNQSSFIAGIESNTPAPTDISVARRQYRRMCIPREREMSSCHGLRGSRRRVAAGLDRTGCRPASDSRRVEDA